MKANMNSTVLSAENVRKQYGKFNAVDGASLDLYPSEILALLGPNGAGKTTFIKILATLLQKDSGSVSVLGQDIDRDPEAIRHLIGYVGEDSERSAYARLTVWENLLFFGSLRGMRRDEIRAQASRLAAQFDFESQMNKLFVTLSGGQKQTVVIIRALLHDPPIIYLDEPTKGLDPLIARRIRAFLKSYAHEQGKTMLLTSHIMSEVDEMSDRVALIQRGRIHVVDRPERLKNALGARDFIELEKSALPAATIQHIQQLPQVSTFFERDPGWISFGVSDVLQGAEAIIQTMRQDGVTASFRHHTVSLEDAFLHQIGELNEHFE